MATRIAAAVRPRPRREREQEVLVWPDLVFIEFIAAVLFTITLLLLSTFLDAPLLNRADATTTPTPSKAPWYFLTLQELLLRMDPAWAGVIVPTIALIALAAIPYWARQSWKTLKSPMVKLRSLQLMLVSRPRRLRAQSRTLGQTKSELRPVPRMKVSVHSTCLEPS